MYGLWPILTTSSLTKVRVWRCNVWDSDHSRFNERLKLKIHAIHDVDFVYAGNIFVF